MLFHVTIAHTDGDCPGRQPDKTPELADDQRAEQLGGELSVKQHSLVWAAPCILWAEPEHVAYAVLEGADLDAVGRYLKALIPDGWTTRVLPVFVLPGQVAAMRQLLGAPAISVAAQPEADARVAADVDTLKGVSVGEVVATPAPPAEEAPDKRVTRAVPQPAPQQASTPPVDTASVTRFIDRRALLESVTTPAPLPPPTPPAPQPDQLAVVSGLTGDEPFAASESSTIILEPKAQPTTALRLVASSGPAHGSVFQVGEDGATLGRLPDNSICLTDGRLSRHHARIDFRDDGFWLSDLGSQNGTLVNDRPVTDARRLQVGDSIELGTTRLSVMLDSDD